MNNSEMGRVHAWLLRHRIVESRSERRSVGKEEREIAGLLLNADYAVRRQFEEILEGQDCCWSHSRPLTRRASPLAPRCSCWPGNTIPPLPSGERNGW